MEPPPQAALGGLWGWNWTAGGQGEGRKQVKQKCWELKTRLYPGSLCFADVREDSHGGRDANKSEQQLPDFSSSCVAALQARVLGFAGFPSALWAALALQ